MQFSLLSIASRNLLGNIVLGALFTVLGALDLTGCCTVGEFVCLLAVLVISASSFAANVSKRREVEDEMSYFYSGRAANFALWTTLIAVGIACAFGNCISASVNVSAACYLIIGFALLVYGVSYAVLERRGSTC